MRRSDRWRLALWALGASFVVAVGAAAAVEPAKHEPAAAVGRRIVAVELRGDGPIAAPEGLHAVLGIGEGEPFDPAQVEAALRALAATGLAESAEAWTQERADGLALVFVVRTAVQVREVRVEGELGLDRARLLAVLPQKGGQPLVEDRILRGSYRLSELYRSEGYFRSSVRLGVDFEAGRRSAVLT